MPRRQEHLAAIVEEFGTGAATTAIVRLVEDGLEAQNAQRDEEYAAKGGKRNPHISDFRKCPRKVYFSLTGEPETEPLTTDSLINFGVGHAIEEWLAEILEAQDLTIQREVRVEIPHNGTVISGRADFLVAVYISLPGGRTSNILIEMKSINSRAMGWMVKRGEPGREEHRAQLGGYLHASHLGLLGRAGENCIRCQGKGSVGEDRVCRRCFPLFRTGVLLYVVKDPTKGEPVLHCFEVPYDRDLVTNDLNDLATIAQWAKEGTDPGIPVGYTKKQFPCSYCGFRTRCFG